MSQFWQVCLRKAINKLGLGESGYGNRRQVVVSHEMYKLNGSKSVEPVMQELFEYLLFSLFLPLLRNKLSQPALLTVGLYFLATAGQGLGFSPGRRQGS